MATQDIISYDVYEHMLSLHVALLILVDPKLCISHSDVAQNLLEHFVTSFGGIYGDEHLIYNVISLVHIVYEVRRQIVRQLGQLHLNRICIKPRICCVQIIMTV